MLSDLRHAFRQLAKAPGFAAVAILTLALCIGANSAIFSIVNAILLKPYPWPNSDRLVYVHNSFPKISGSSGSGISIPDYLDHRAGVTAFAESALINGFNANLATGDSPERVYGLMVTPSLFTLLQTPPALGRAFTATEAAPGVGKTVVLLHPFWKNRFGGDPAIIGRTIRLNGEAHTVVGVMPEGFYFPSLRAQLFVPYAFTPRQTSEAERTTQYSTMIARLKPDATLAQAQRELDDVHRATRERVPALRAEFESTGYGSRVVGYLETNVKDVRVMLWLLQAGVAAALLIGCANVANLLLTRASVRQREFAIRSALGASRMQIVRQLLGETALLFLLGGALGVLVAMWGLSAVNTLGVGDLPRGFGVALDGRVLAFTFACALATGLAFGALPAWAAARGDAADALKSAGTRTTASRRQLGLRNALAVTQIALSLLLLATAGLLIRSFARVQDESPGFVTDRVLTASLALPAAKYPTPEKRAAFAAQLTAQLEAAPGVAAAGIINALPFAGGNPQGGYAIVGRPVPAGQANPNGVLRQVSPGYFSAMGITLQRGRLLEPADALGREKVVVVDRFFADRHFPALSSSNGPGADPIGQRIMRDENANVGVGTWTIVGVVSTIKNLNLEQTVTKETIYFPFAQTPNTNLTLVVRGVSEPAAPVLNRAERLASAIRTAVLAVDPEQPVYDVKTMDARIDESLQRRRAPMLLLTVFAGVAVLLAALGIYGVLAFSVGQRTQEIGVRMALGADRASILALILRQGGVLVAIGLVVGLAGYFALRAVIAQQLFGIAATDPVTLITAPLVLAIVALAACLIPARRATKVDPITALRAE